MLRIISFICLLSLSLPGYALEVITGKVKQIEVTYMPDRVIMRMDKGNATCPAGTSLVWAKSVENNKAILATLLTAYASSINIQFYFNNGDTTCTGLFIYAINSN